MKNNHETKKQEQITRLKKESAALEQAEKERDRLFNLSIDMLCIAGFDGYFKQLNPAWEKALGWTNAELMAKPYLDFVHPEDREHTIKAASGLADGKTVITFDNRYLCKNGTYKWISWNSLPMVEEQLIVAVARDITQSKQIEGELNQYRGHLEELVQKRSSEIKNALEQLQYEITVHKLTEETLKTSEERFRLLVEGVEEYAIFMLDPEGKIVSWNTGAERIKGYKDKEILGQHFSIFFPEEDIQRAKPEKALQIASTEGRYEDETLRVRKDGSKFWASVVITALRDASGNLRGFSKITRDITARIEKDNALRKVNRALKTLSECNQALVRADNESALLNNICEILVTHGGYRMAWIAFAEHDEKKSIRPVAQKGYEEGYLDKAKLTWADTERGRSTVGTAIRTQQISISKDVASDPNFAPWHEEILKLGYGSIIALPLIANSEVFGALAICASEPDAFDAAEIELLTELKNDLAYGIKALRIREEHNKTEEELRRNEARLELQFNRLSALRSIDLAITGTTDMRIVLNVILEQIASVLKADAMDVLLLNPHTHLLEFSAGRGFRTSILRHTRLSLGDGYAGRAALERHVIHVPNLGLEKNSLKRAPLLSEEGFVAYYGMPLIAKGHVRGVLEVFHRKPFNPDQEWLDFLEALSGQAAVAIDSASLFSELQRSTTELIVAYDRTLEGWSSALDLRDKETEGHTLRVTELTMDLARTLGISDEELVHIRRGALLHDIGKMGVPDSILLKPGALTEEEWVIMRKHPVYAYELLYPITYLRPALDIPHYHHEKWDGSGYPRGLKEDQIPLAARMFAIIDVWDAVRSDRPYRPAWPEEKAIDHLRNQAGKHFDPKILDTFLSIISTMQSQKHEG